MTEVIALLIGCAVGIVLMAALNLVDDEANR